MERYQAGAYALAMRMLGDPDLAADVIQDSFFSAYRAVGSFRGSSFRAWLYRIVSKLASTIFGPGAPSVRISGCGAGSDLERMREPVPSMIPAGPHRCLLGSRTAGTASRGHRHIQSALLELPTEQRLALILCDIQSLPYDEIARVMDTSVGTVKSRIARGRGHLRRILLRDGELSESTAASWQCKGYI